MITALLALALPALASTKANTKDGVGIKGYDPVSYFGTSGPAVGKKELTAEHNGVTYRFSSETNLAEFKKTPQKYVPQYDGWCAYAVAESSSKVDIDPKSFLVQDGKLLLFYNGFFGDTRKKWLGTKSKSAEQYLAEAEKNWPATQNKEP